MSSVIESRGNLIELHYSNDADKVRIVPSNRSLLLMSVDEAIAACRAFKQQVQFSEQFDLLLNHIGDWLRGHRKEVSSAFLTTRDAGLFLLVVTNATEYDSEFEEKLTELDIQIANDSDFHLIELSVLAIPKCSEESINSFLSKKMQLRFVPNGNGR